MGFFFFPKELDVNMVINNVTYSPKSSLGYTGITHKVTNDSIKNLDYPTQSRTSYRNILCKIQREFVFYRGFKQMVFSLPN